MKEEIFERTGADDPLQALRDFGAQVFTVDQRAEAPIVERTVFSYDITVSGTQHI